MSKRKPNGEGAADDPIPFWRGRLTQDYFENGRMRDETWPFVVRIAAAWQKATESIIETGRLLIEAKAALPHGKFEGMIVERLPFTARTAQMLMTIARHPVLSNAKFVSHLPPSWGTLYALTAIPDDDLIEHIKNNHITPDTKRRDIPHLLGGQVPFEKVRDAFSVILHFMRRMYPAEVAENLKFIGGLVSFFEEGLLDSDKALLLLPRYVAELVVEDFRLREGDEPPHGRAPLDVEEYKREMAKWLLEPWEPSRTAAQDIAEYQAKRKRLKKKAAERAAAAEAANIPPPASEAPVLVNGAGHG